MKLYYIRGTAIIERIRFLSPKKIYEKEACDAILAELKSAELKKIGKDKPVFFDIGANIGLISMYVAKHTDATIRSFEPGITQFPILAINVITNKLQQRWSAHNIAFSDKNGVANFFSSTDERNNGSDGLLDTKRSPSDSYSYAVDTRTADSWTRDHGIAPDVMKIDVEGAEKFVLEGAREMIQAHKPVIFLEISEENLKVYPYGVADVLNYVNGLGYTVYDLEGEACTIANYHKLLEKDDLFVARPNK